MLQLLVDELLLLLLLCCRSQGRLVLLFADGFPVLVGPELQQETGNVRISPGALVLLWRWMLLLLLLLLLMLLQLEMLRGLGLLWMLQVSRLKKGKHSWIDAGWHG